MPIGVIEELNHLPARADLLAPDLRAVAAIIEAGVRRDAAVRDAVGLSTLSNVMGLIWGWRGMPGIEVAVHAVYLTALAALADAWLRLSVTAPRARKELDSFMLPSSWLPFWRARETARPPSL